MVLRALRNIVAIVGCAALGWICQMLAGVPLELSEPELLPSGVHSASAAFAGVIGFWLVVSFVGFLPCGALAAVVATKPWRLRAPLYSAVALGVWELATGFGTAPTSEFHQAYKAHVFTAIPSWLGVAQQAAAFIGLVAGTLLGALIVQRLLARRDQGATAPSG
ncbi:MAG TPA: hypothetical protein VGM19_14400 [Armatimonadota bacterium]